MMTNLVNMNGPTASVAANNDKPDTFEIFFDRDINNGENVFPGEELQGKVKLVLSKQTQFTRLHVSFKGESSTNTSWLHKYSAVLTANDCGASEMYFNKDLMLFESGKCLEIGTHLFPYQFTVPSGLNLPASFEGDHGHVRYFVAAHLDRFLYAKKLFNVVGEQRMVLDQNCLLSALAPVSGNGKKKIPHMCCLSTRISLFAKTDRKAYKPGETILLSGTIDNHSNCQIRHLSLTLVQKALYANSATEYPSGESHRVLVEETFDICCDKSSRIDFSDKPLVTPRCCPPSGLPGCGIIDIEYFVCVEAEASVRLAVDIGTSVCDKTVVQHDDSGSLDLSELTDHYNSQSEESLELTISPYKALLGDDCSTVHTVTPHTDPSGEHCQCHTRPKSSPEEPLKTHISTLAPSEEDSTDPPGNPQMTLAEEDPYNTPNISYSIELSNDDSPLLAETSAEDISLQTSLIPPLANHQTGPIETQDIDPEIISLIPPLANHQTGPIEKQDIDPEIIKSQDPCSPVSTDEDSNQPTSPSSIPLDTTLPRSPILNKTSVKKSITRYSVRSSVTFSIPGQCFISQPIASSSNPHSTFSINRRQLLNTTSNNSSPTCEGAIADLQNIQNEHSHTIMNIDEACASLGNRTSQCYVP